MAHAKSFFDEWASVYDDYLPKLPQYRRLATEAIRISGAKAGHAVLEAGIGTGYIGLAMSREGCNVTGIDTSKEMLSRCKEKARDWDLKVELRQADIRKLPFHKDSFDAIISSLVVHHLEDNEKLLALSEFHRVLKKGSRLVLGEVLVDEEGDIFGQKRLKHILKRWGYAAENALKHAGGRFAAMEMEAMLKVYLRDRECLTSRQSWMRLLSEAGFSKVGYKMIDKRLGFSIIYAEK